MSNEELVELYQSGDNKALETLIENNKRIIYKIANKYNGINKVMDIDDLKQNGVLGLIKAAQKYDFNNEKKAKFITYAVYYIDRFIYTCVNGYSSRGEGNTKFYNSCTSLNVPIGEEGETAELGDLIECEDYGFENIEEEVYLKQLREQLEESMEQYNTLEERQILKFRYGWNTKIMTLNEVAEILDITGERVRQKENMALRKLRNSKWGRINAKGFLELGYIDEFFLGIFKRRGVNLYD